MPEASGLWVTIKARTSGFTKGVKNARKGLRDFKRSIPGVNLLLNKFNVAIAGAAAALGSAVWIKNTLGAVDATAKFADRIGATVEGLQTLQHAAELTGVGVSSLQMGLQRMTRRVAEAAQGTGEAQGALKELRLDARELTQLRPEEVFRRIAGAMSRVKGQADKVRLSMKLFDSEGVALVNTLNMGEDGLERLNERLAKTGLLFSRMDAARIEEANDAISRLRMTVQAAANLTVSALAPAIRQVTEGLRGWIEGKGSFRERVFDVMSRVATWIDAVVATLEKAVLSLDVVVAKVQLARETAKGMLGGNLGGFASARSDAARAQYRLNNYEAGTVMADFVEKMRQAKDALPDLKAMQHVKWNEQMKRALIPAGGVGGTQVLDIMDLVDRTEAIRDRGGPRNNVEREMLAVLKGIYRRVGSPATAR